MLKVRDGDDGVKVGGGRLVQLAQLACGVEAERFAELLRLRQAKHSAVGVGHFVKLADELAA